MSQPSQLLPLQDVQAELFSALSQLSDMPVEILLERKGLLRPLMRDILLEKLRSQVRFTDEELQLIQDQLFQGLAFETPQSLDGDWIKQLPESVQLQIQPRWDQLRLRKWMEERYGQYIEAHYLSRQQELEQVVFRMIRLQQQGLAEELYLRLIDNEESFGDLASRYSLGEERYTRGVVGPLPITQPHPTVRAVLARLSTGDIAPPFVADNTILLLRLEHRIPSRLDEAMRQQLLRELLQPDLEATVEALVAQVIPSQCSVSVQHPAPTSHPRIANSDVSHLRSAKPIPVGNDKHGTSPAK